MNVASHGYIPSGVFYKGKCDTCHEQKYLDSMVRKEGAKGLYHCLDCEVDEGSWVEDIFDYPACMFEGPWWLAQQLVEEIKHDRQISKTRKAMAWLFG